MKKAKEKVAPSTLETAAAPASDFKLVFGDPVMELTGDRLDHILATYEAAAGASAGRAPLVTKLNALQEERDALREKDGDKMMALQSKRDEVKVCYEQGYSEAGQRRMQEYANRALTDPALREKFARVAAENNAAASQGDSAAIARAQNAMLEEVLPTKEDSASVRKQCGAVPPPSAQRDEVGSLDKQIAALNEQIRAIDTKVSQAQANRAGSPRTSGAWRSIASWDFSIRARRARVRAGPRSGARLQSGARGARDAPGEARQFLS